MQEVFLNEEYMIRELLFGCFKIALSVSLFYFTLWAGIKLELNTLLSTLAAFGAFFAFMFFGVYDSAAKRREHALARKSISKERIIFLSGGMTKEKCEDVLKELLYLDKLECAPIKLCINSEGGLHSARRALANGISSLRSEVTGIVIGQAGSAAALLLQECARRIAFPNTTLLFHETRQRYCVDVDLTPSSINILLDDVQKIQKELTEIQEEADQLVMRRSGLTREVLTSFFEVPLSVEEALKLNLIDEIVEKI